VDEATLLFCDHIVASCHLSGLISPEACWRWFVSTNADINPETDAEQLLRKHFLETACKLNVNENEGRRDGVPLMTRSNQGAFFWDASVAALEGIVGVVQPSDMSKLRVRMKVIFIFICERILKLKFF
jgi:hypothetical protein